MASGSCSSDGGSRFENCLPFVSRQDFCACGALSSDVALFDRVSAITCPYPSLKSAEEKTE
jgi:hypothetical protein